MCARKERHDVAKSNVQVRTHLFTFDVCVRTRIALSFDFNECVKAASNKRDVDTDVVRIQSNFWTGVSNVYFTVAKVAQASDIVLNFIILDEFSSFDM